MRKLILIVTLSSFFLTLNSQPNCNVFLWEGDTLQYEACKHSEYFKYFYQFDLKGIAILDSCMKICPAYAFPYYEKAVPYLKAGNPLGWNKYINLAVKYDPLTYLTIRASCRSKFFADYNGAIKDIDSLHSIVKGDIGYTHDGTYHMEIYKGICYKAIGKYSKAIKIIEKFIANDPSAVGSYDYIHLGVAYQKMNKHQKAIECFKKQEAIYDIAENQYYLAKSYLANNELKMFFIAINKAKEKISRDEKMNNKYHVLEDEIFEEDINDLLRKI